jgi:hypothetical protein
VNFGWTKAGAALACLIACAAAHAERNYAVYGAVGTGIGLGVATPITDSVNARADFMFGRLNRNVSTDTVDYEGKFRLRNLGAYADWKPFNGVFRLSGGAVFADTTADLRGVPRTGSFTVGNAVIAAAAGESITAHVSMPKLRPYLGIGWGLSDLRTKGWTFGLDIGAIIGRPKSDLQVTPLIAAAAGPANVEIERQRLSDEVHKLKAEPVIKLSVGYVF